MLTLLLGCSPVAESVAGLDWSVEIGAPLPPPAGAVTLTVSGFVEGGTATLTASGLGVGDMAWFGGSLAGVGAGPCPPPLGGACLGILPAVFKLGTDAADAAGEATIAWPLPPSLTAGDVVALQVVVPVAGNPAVLSQAVLVTVAGEDPVDTGDPASTPETCNGVDDDGDGLVDEGFDADGDGIADCFEVMHDTLLTLTADDAWELWIDGVPSGSHDWWYDAIEVPLTLESGPHVWAIHAWDIFGLPSGLQAALQVDGAVVAATGDGQWSMTRVKPPAEWRDVDFDDSAWGGADTCVGGWWGGTPAVLYGLGAEMVWEGDCTGVGQTWFRLEMVLP